MELEKQVCSIELAKRLKELGVKQESLFYWMKFVHSEKLSEGEGYALQVKPVDGLWGSANMPKMFGGMRDNTSAFTVAELGEMLKEYTFKEVDTAHGKEMWVMYCHFRECVFRCGDNVKMECVADTEADARAKMLIYLLEDKLITL